MKTEQVFQQIDYECGIPLHLQIRNILKEEILKKVNVDEKGKIPTEIALTKRFDVSRITVRNALNLLVEEGIIYRERGRGTFARPNNPESWSGRLMGFTEIIKESGFTPNTNILSKGTVKDGEDFNKVKEKLTSEDIWELKRLRLADDTPIAIEHAFYPGKYKSSLESQDLKTIAIYKFFEDEMRVFLREAKQMISAVNADKKTAEMLNVKEGEALLYVERLTVSSEEEPIEFLKAIYRPDHFHYLIRLSNKN